MRKDSKCERGAKPPSPASLLRSLLLPCLLLLLLPCLLLLLLLHLLRPPAQLPRLVRHPLMNAQVPAQQAATAG
jgi:hypothetical protein